MCVCVCVCVCMYVCKPPACKFSSGFGPFRLEKLQKLPMGPQFKSRRPGWDRLQYETDPPPGGLLYNFLLPPAAFFAPPSVAGSSSGIVWLRVSFRTVNAAMAQ